MQTSLLKKLLLRIKRKDSREPRESSAETSESRETSDMINEETVDEQNCCDAADQHIEAADQVSSAEEGVKNDPPSEDREPRGDGRSNKAHLTSSVPRVARIPRGALSKGEMAEIRELLGDVDDAEIQRLYKRVTK